MVKITTAFVEQLRVELGADNVCVTETVDRLVLTATKDGETVVRTFAGKEEKFATCWEALKNS